MARHEAWRQDALDRTRAAITAALSARPIDVETVARLSLENELFGSVDAAVETLAKRIGRHIGRELNKSETIKLGIVVAIEWNKGEAAKPRVNGWHTSDGRYFSSDLDAAAHQRTLDAKQAEFRARLARVIDRMAGSEESVEEAAND